MTEKKKGRPPIEIDQEQFEKLCEILPTAFCVIWRLEK